MKDYLKMKFSILVMFSLILILPLALAVEISLPKDNYDLNEIVTISVFGCAETSLLMINNPLGFPVTVDQGFASWQMNYNTGSDNTLGKYELVVNCADGTSQTKEFCLGEDCVVSKPEPETIKDYYWFADQFMDYNGSYFDFREEYYEITNQSVNNDTINGTQNNQTYQLTSDDLEDLGELGEDLDELREDLEDFSEDIDDYIGDLEDVDPVNETLLNVSEILLDAAEDLLENVIDLLDKTGFDPDCNTYWTCTEWTTCKNGTKSQICTDQNSCKESYEEVVDCFMCLESWNCTAWDSCSGGKQTRTCTDKYYCGTTLTKPSEEQSCQGSSSGKSSGVSGKSEPEEDLDLNNLDVGLDQQGISQENIPEPDFTFESEETEPLKEKSKFTPLLLIVASIVLLIIIGGLVFLLYLKPKLDSANEIKEYIKKEKIKNVPLDKVKKTLVENGWDEKEVNKYLK
jgi:hypothetical protein